MLRVLLLILPFCLYMVNPSAMATSDCSFLELGPGEDDKLSLLIIGRSDLFNYGVLIPILLKFFPQIVVQSQRVP